ncbi:MAG: family 16 glycoside hydrolase [Limisphaerales bacterium]
MEPEDNQTSASTGSEFGHQVADLVPGQKVGGGRYTLIQFLGKGGMGIVWLAKDERLGETLALKLLPAQISGDPVALDDMRRETLKSRRLSHPNIIRIHDIFEADTEPCFISMEFVDGPNLSRLRLQQPGRLFAWDYLAPLVKQLCDGLDYAHSERVIHRDLKPANMMLDSRGRLKLADFGIAAVVSDSMSRVSLKHSTSGTVTYMSPHQMNGQRPQPADDIYSLGATLYELLSSRPPFYRGDIINQVQNIEPQSLAERLAELELTNEIPRAVSDAVIACLAKDPAQRPASAGAVAEWMGLQPATQPLRPQFANPEPEPELAPEPEGPVAGTIQIEDQPQEEAVPEPADSKRTGLWIGVGLAAVLVLAVCGWFIKKASNRRSASSKTPANASSSAAITPAAAASTQPFTLAAKPISLIPLVSLPRDAVKGDWTVASAGLSVQTPAAGSALQFPYQPPEEYDFEIEFTPQAAGMNVNQYISVQGRSFAWKLNSHGRTPPLYGFELLDGKKATEQPEAAVNKPLVIETGKRYTSKVEVRRTGLRGLVNGEEYVKWSGDFSRFSMEDVTKLGDDRHLGVGSWKRAVVFHRAEVLEVTGKGQMAAASAAPTFRPLFDGQTFAGWRGYTSPEMPADCKVDRGTFTGPAKALIVTKEEFGDFELLFDWKVGALGNGGIYFRIPMDDGGQLPLSAPEFQLLDDAVSAPPVAKNGSLFGIVPPIVAAGRAVGDWNTGRLVARGGSVEHYVNDQLVCRYDLRSAEFQAMKKLGSANMAGNAKYGQTTRGPIGLQFWGGEVAYRNLRIRPL